MFWSHLKLGLRVSFVAVPLLSAVPASAQQAKSEGYDFFEKKIRPVLVEHCYKCHSASAEKVGSSLFSVESELR